MFSCEYLKNFKNTYFEEHVRKAAFQINWKIDFCTFLCYYNQFSVYDIGTIGLSN